MPSRTLISAGMKTRPRSIRAGEPSSRASSWAAPAPPPAPTAAAQTGIVRLIDAYRDLGHFLAHLDPAQRARRQPPAAGTVRVRPDRGRPRPHLRHQPFRRPAAGHAARAARRPARDLLPHHRRRVHAHPGHAHPPLAPGAHGAAPQPAQLRPRQEAAHPHEPALRRAVRAVPAHPLRRPEALLAGRGRDADPAARRHRREGRRTAASREIVMGMAHRGRLNVLANILRKPYQEIFAEFEDNYLPDSMDGDGDVKYHLGFSSDRDQRRRQADPPVADAQPQPPGSGRSGGRGPDAGQAAPVRRPRAQPGHPAADPRRRRLRRPGPGGRDAQPVAAGRLHAPAAPSTSSSTTRSASPPSPSDARSTTYCTDVAKMIQVPIFHVNGEDPEAAVYVAELALEFRQTFHKRRGHRHVLLPPARPQRGRRAVVHPAAHVQQDQGPADAHRGLHRTAHHARRPDRGRDRGASTQKFEDKLQARPARGQDRPARVRRRCAASTGQLEGPDAALLARARSRPACRTRRCATIAEA